MAPPPSNNSNDAPGLHMKLTNRRRLRRTEKNQLNHQDGKIFDLFIFCSARHGDFFVMFRNKNGHLMKCRFFIPYFCS